MTEYYAQRRAATLVDHPKVAEAAVVGRTHEIKGHALAAFVTVTEGIKPSEDLADELKRHVAHKIGAIARPDDIIFSADLPKMRSGKIMRRLLRDIAEGKALGDTTTWPIPPWWRSSRSSTSRRNNPSQGNRCGIGRYRRARARTATLVWNPT